MNERAPQYIVKLHFQSPEGVLQERVSDGQIANAILDRLPV